MNTMAGGRAAVKALKAKNQHVFGPKCDGGFGMILSELSTAVDHEINTLYWS